MAAQQFGLNGRYFYFEECTVPMFNIFGLGSTTPNVGVIEYPDEMWFEIPSIGDPAYTQTLHDMNGNTWEFVYYQNASRSLFIDTYINGVMLNRSVTPTIIMDDTPTKGVLIFSYDASDGQYSIAPYFSFYANEGRTPAPDNKPYVSGRCYYTKTTTFMVPGGVDGHLGAGTRYSDMLAGPYVYHMLFDAGPGFISWNILTENKQNSAVLSHFTFGGVVAGNENDGTEITAYFFGQVSPEEVPVDPYAGGGYSGTGGGGFSPAPSGTDIGIPPSPGLAAANTGFVSIYVPTLPQIKALANYMWSNGFDINTLKKMFANPMDSIIGLSIVPVNVPDSGTQEVVIGNLTTGIYMDKASTQYVQVDCGSVTIGEQWHGYLDYDPFTKIDLYLPYIGIRPVAADLVMGKSVHVTYTIDILSGACVVFVECGGKVLYTFVGQCSSTIPVTNADWSNAVNGALSIAAAVGTMIATEGATAPMVAGIGTIASSAVNCFKPSIEKSGGMSGTGGMLAIQTPYFIVTRPRQALPAGQNVYTGYPSYITKSLGDLTGYTEIDSIHIENVPATSDELNEIETLLKGGVIL